MAFAVIATACNKRYSGWDSNPHGPYGPFELKSNVAANYTTGASYF